MRPTQTAWSLGLAATLMLSACAQPATTAPVAPPQDTTMLRQNTPNAPVEQVAAPQQEQQEQQAQDTSVPEPSSQQVSPLESVQAPPAPNMAQNGGLTGPNGSMITLDGLGGQIPACIPQPQATQYLQPITGIANYPYATTPFGSQGCGQGLMPELMNYGALSHCLYYPYQGYYIPYILAGGNYYPYCYAPYYNTAWANSYIYPMFYSYGNNYYPYYLYSNDYYGGYCDWEYNWSGYRNRNDHDWDHDRQQYSNRWNNERFAGWLSRRGNGSRNGGNERQNGEFRGRSDHRNGNVGERNNRQNGDVRRGDHQKGDVRSERSNQRHEKQGKQGKQEKLGRKNSKVGSALSGILKGLRKAGEEESSEEE